MEKLRKSPNLLQYVPSGAKYARIKLDGKLFRSSLETEVWATAKLKRADFIFPVTLTGRLLLAAQQTQLVGKHSRESAIQWRRHLTGG